MSNLEKAREWANRNDRIQGVFHPDAQAAVEVIQSLPDRWADADKLRELINRQEKTPPSSVQERDFVRELWGLIHEQKLRTLADMTAEERKACQWMQCAVETDHEDVIGVIRRVWSKSVDVIFQSGQGIDPEHRRVTPLPDLPKLQWPGSEATVSNEEIVADDQAVAKDVCNSESNSSETPKSSIKPEDVPPNEPWLIEVDDQKAIGARYEGVEVAPWAVAYLDGSFTGDYLDSEITLIHKLVPEPPALPEGMRLADHESFGRVVVAPRANTHGEEFFYRLGEDSLWGASYGYRPTEEFTFLDGEQ